MLKLKQVSCLFENAKQVFKTLDLSKCDTDNGDHNTNNNSTSRPNNSANNYYEMNNYKNNNSNDNNKSKLRANPRRLIIKTMQA